MPSKIGVVLALDGEREFVQGMRNAKQSAQTLKGDLASLKKEYKDNANSLEYLTARQGKLEEAQAAYERTLNAAKAGQSNARKAYKEQANALEELRTKLDAAEDALRDMEKAGDTSSDSYKSQKKAVDDLQKAVSDQSANYLKAEGRLSAWDTKVSKAEKDIKSNSKAVDQNSRYLDEARRSADGCAKSIDKYGRQTSQAAEETGELSDALKGGIVGGAIAGGIQLAAGAAKELSGAAKEAAEYVVDVGSTFEASMSKVKALSGASASQLEALSGKAKELGASTRFSASEVADGFSYMALAGWDADTMLSAIDGVLNLAAASEMDLATASDMVTDYLSAFGMEASQAGEMADMMAYAQANANTSTIQLGDAFGNCASTMNTAGQSMRTTTAVLEAMANQGLKGSEAGTALAAIMSQITQKMDDGAIQIGETTVAVQDEAGNFRDLVDIIRDVDAATQGMGSAQKSAALGAVFNGSSLKGLQAVLNEGVDNVADYAAALDNCSGAAAEMAGTMQDNLKGALTELGSATEGLGIAIYEGIADPLTDLVDVATGAISAITDAITPETTRLDSFLSEVEASIQSTERSIQAARDAISNGEADAAKLETYKKILIETNGAQDEFSQYQIKSIVDELAASIPELTNAWDDNKNKLTLTNAAIKELIENQEELILQQSQMEARASAMKAYNDAKVAAAMAQSAFTEALKEAGEESGQTFQTMEAAVRYYSQTGVAITSTYNRLVDAHQKVGESSKNVEEAKDLYELTDKALSEMDVSVRKTESSMDEASSTTEELTEETEDLSEAAAAAADAYEEAGDRIADAFEKAKDEAEKAFQVNPFDTWDVDSENGIAKMQQALDSQIEGLTNYTANLDVVRQNLAQTSPEFVSYLEQMGTGGAQVVQELADAFAAGDSSKAEALINSYIKAMDQKDKLSSTIAADKTAIEAGLGKLGSSAREWAKLDTVISTLQESGSALSSTTAEAFRTAAETAQAAGVAIPEGLIDGIESSEDPEGAVRSAVEQINAAVEGQGQALLEMAQAQGINVPAGIAEGIASGGEAAASAYRELLELITGSSSGTAEAGAGSGQEIVDSTADSIKDNAGTAADAAREMSETAVSEAENAAGAATAGGQAFDANYASGIASQAGAPASAAASMAASALSSAAAYSGSYYGVGLNAAAGMASGINAGRSGVINAAANMAAAALRAAQAALEIKSPSRKFARLVGKQMPAGTAFGIRQNTGLAVDAAVSMAGQTLAAARRWLKANKANVEGIGYTWNAYASKALKSGFGIDQYTTTGSGKDKKTVRKGTETYYGEVFQAAEGYLANVKTLYNVSAKQELEYWKSVSKSVRYGTQAWYDAQAKVKEATAAVKAEKAEAKRAEADALAAQLAKYEDYAAHQEAIGKMSIKAEQAYWKKRLALFKKGTAEYKAIQEKLVALQADIGTITAAETLLENYQTYYKLSERGEMQYWDMIRKRYKAGTDERIAADQKYLDARSAYYDRLKELEESYAEKIEEANARYTEAVDARRAEIMSAFDLFEAFESSSATGRELLFNIQSQAAGYEEWSRSIDQLAGRGALSESLMAELTSRGPQDIAAIKALLTLTADELQAYQKAYDRKEAAATAQAEKENAGLKKEVAAEIKSLQAQLAADKADVSEVISSELAVVASKIKTIAEDQTAALMAAFRSGSGQTLSGGTGDSVDTKTQSAAGVTHEQTNGMTDKQLKASVTEVISSGTSRSKKLTKDDSGRSDLVKYLIQKYGRSLSMKKLIKLADLLGIQHDSGTLTSAQKNALLEALKAKGFAGGSRRVSGGLSWIDEQLDSIGPEMVVRRADKAILTRLEASDAVVPANLASNLFKWGAIDPDQLQVASMAYLNDKLAAGYAAQMQAAAGSGSSALGTVVALLESFLPYLAQPTRAVVSRDEVIREISDGMSIELAQRARRVR